MSSDANSVHHVPAGDRLSCREDTYGLFSGTLVTAPHCPLCGTRFLPDASPAGLCPACLFKNAFSTEQDFDERPDDYPATLAPGTTVGPFRILGLLGRGGMSTVYEARDPGLERAVALKVLPQEFLHGATFVRRFEHEARVVARLEHPHIVPIFATGIDNDIPWMSMRLLPGGNLGTLLEHRRPEPRDAVRMLRRVADALDYAHASGVVHRDIKPTNILLDGTGGVYLGDFGLAQLLEDDLRATRTGTLVGTPHYIAPERALGQTADHRCDIYSLGIVAYEMFVGAPPFAADSPMAVLLKHVSEPLPAPPDGLLPRRLVDALRRATAKDPEERWPSAGTFVAALEVALGMTPETLVTVGNGEARHPDVQARLGWAGAAVAALAVAIGLTWWAAQEAAYRPVSVPPPSEWGHRIATRIGDPDIVPRAIRPAPNPTPQATTGAPASARPTEPPPTEPPVKAPDQGQRDAATAAESPLLPVPVAAETPTPPTLTPPTPTPTPPSPAPSVDTPDSTDRKQGAVPVPIPAPDVVTQPILLRKVDPEYPPAMATAGWEGALILQAVVDTDGRIRDVIVLKRSINPQFDEAARKAFLQYEYEPGRRNGVPVPLPIERTFFFKLP